MEALMGSKPAPELEELEKQHATLVKKLKPFKREDVMAIVATLLTYPQFHANTIRLETLQQLVQRNCTGNNIPGRHRITEWLIELGKGWAGNMEDPVEDVFISNVVTNIGNSRVFEGIWEANDFWLQQALDALWVFRREAWACGLFEKINAVLNVSEALARRCGLQRFAMGGGATRETFDLPPEVELQQRRAKVRFSFSELDELGVPLDLLELFIHDEHPAVGTESSSSLQRRPLQRVDDGILVAIPAAISPAVRLAMIDELIRVGKIEAYERALFTRQANQLFVDGLTGLDATHVAVDNLAPLPNGTPATAQEVVRFDVGKFAHVIFFEDRLLEFREDGITGVLDLVKGYGGTIVDHVGQCARQIANRRDYQAGLTIAVVGGLGRSFVFGVGELPPRWYGTAFRLPDFSALSRVHRTRLLSIWKLKEYERSLNSRGVEIFNVNGELNLLGYWHAHGERIVQRSAPITAGRTMLQIGMEFIADVREKMRTRYDFHAVPRRNPDAWVPVRRYNIDPFFKELEETAIYADEQAVSRDGRLRGIVETDRRQWWLSTVDCYENGLHRDTQFRIWEALLFWLPKLIVVAEAELDRLPEGPVEILLRFSDLESWRSQTFRDLPGSFTEIGVRIVRRVPIIEITVPAGFLRRFAEPKNVGERGLVDACFKGLAAMAGRLADFNRSVAVDRVLLNDDARFFHMVYAQDFRQQAGSLDRIKTRFIPDGDFNFASVGLAQRIVGQPSDIDGPKRCNDFLHRVVDDSWERIRSILQNLSRQCVIVRALRNVEAVEQDRHQWEMTAKAVLATHSDQDSVVNAAHERENKRSEAALASRIIAEMAVCTCPDTGLEISEAHFDTLLGLIRLLLYAATSSDAITYGLTPARLRVYPNGEFTADDDYYKHIVGPYTSEQFTGQYKEAAQRYADYFVDPASKTRRDDRFEQPFINAFQAEFGLTPDEFVDAYQALEQDAMPDGKLVVSRTVEQIRKTLKKSGLTSGAADSFIRKFVLWPRVQWDQTPEGFSKKDWYPWRYRRRLSLLSRPLVRLGLNERDTVVFAPGLLRDCVELLLIRLIGGRLPPEDFRSPAMQAWIGEITRRRGNEFEQHVGEEFRTAKFESLVSKSMKLFGADESYGNLDVLAWRKNSDEVYAVECKRLRAAKTVAEIGEQLREFHGAELDRLSRQLRRCRWLREHQDAVRRITATTAKCLNIIPVLVTSTIVPMQFVKHLPIPPTQIIPVSKLQEWLSLRRRDG
jgi:hypothetical protein